ncbi:MAG: methyltransferase domain-containing protein [Ginsengibacter sp.]
MNQFSRRSQEKELLDGDSIDFNDLSQNLKELRFINAYLGGHRITLKGFKSLSAGKKKISICEIGCGGGDNLIALDNFCKKINIEATFTGIDINPACIEYAKENLQNRNIHFIIEDYKKVVFQKKPDILFSSLFCHHFSNEELIDMLQWMKANSNLGFFINDLQRHPIAYYSIRFLTKIFSRSHLVKNDAPLSVLRGFRINEWEKLLKLSGIKPVQIHWEWAFRYLIVYRNIPM